MISDSGAPSTSKDLYKSKVAPALKAQSLEKFKLNKSFKQHIQVKMRTLDDLKPAAHALKSLESVLAVEYLDKQLVFGLRASIDEMSTFKSKVRQQKIIYDPETGTSNSRGEISVGKTEAQPEHSAVSDTRVTDL